MNRRIFLQSGLLGAGAVLKTFRAYGSGAVKDPEVCVMRIDEVVAEAVHPTSYEHYHTLALPIPVLVRPPAEGIKIRTSVLDPDSLDLEAFNEFLRQTGLTRALQTHSHQVSLTREQLNRIAEGETKVNVRVISPKGNFAHEFFFTASPSALIKIKRARGSK